MFRAKPEFSITYEIKDKKQFEEILLIEAIKDAQVKSEIMAVAAKVKLGKIIKIEGSQIFIGNLKSEDVFAKVNDFSLDIESSNINGEAVVTMVWRIDG